MRAELRVRREMYCRTLVSLLAVGRTSPPAYRCVGTGVCTAFAKSSGLPPHDSTLAFCAFVSRRCVLAVFCIIGGKAAVPSVPNCRDCTSSRTRFRLRRETLAHFVTLRARRRPRCERGGVGSAGGCQHDPYLLQV
jgi:hypothetical protein